MATVTSRSPSTANAGTTLAALVLNHNAGWRVLSNWESRLLAGRLAAITVDRPVFIAGLARAGTTMLLRKLCELPDFATHRYADFPFLFTPYAWARLRRAMPAPRQAPRERMHKDGIMVTAESPEAMEEVLWMAFFPRLHDPTVSNVLDERARHPEFEAFFAEHIRKLILARGARRYVSKNNYNVTRLGYLARMFPDARFVLAVRAPQAHVASLMKQHRLFCSIQHDNDAARTHLRLVGHFEFGLDRRPINPGDAAAIAAVEELWRRGEDVRAWAKYWTLIYGHLAARLDADPALASRCLVVRHEDLCDRGAVTMAELCAHVGLPTAPASQLADGLRRPDYYVMGFAECERLIIAEETTAVARRFGYGAQDG